MLASDGSNLTGLWLEGQKYYAPDFDENSVKISVLFEAQKAAPESKRTDNAVNSVFFIKFSSFLFNFNIA